MNTKTKRFNKQLFRSDSFDSLKKVTTISLIPKIYAFRRFCKVIVASPKTFYAETVTRTRNSNQKHKLSLASELKIKIPLTKKKSPLYSKR